MKNILFITGYNLPSPPVRGAAPQELLWNGFVEMNEKAESPEHFTVLSIYDKKAEAISKKCKRTDFVYFKIPFMTKFLDGIIDLLSFIPKVKAYAKYFKSRWYTEYLKKYLVENDFDDVVVEEAPNPLMLQTYESIRNKYKGHFWYHSHSKITFKGVEYWLENLRGIICCSDYIRKHFDSLPCNPHPPGYVLKLFVDQEIFHPKERSEELQAKYGLSDSDFVIMFAGRLLPLKGSDKLIMAFKEVLKEKPNSKLVIVGGNYLKSKEGKAFGAKLNELIEDIKDKVVFTGYVDHSKMGDIYALADLVCLPSICEEGAGLTMAESVSCGKPLITTRSGGVPEYVGEGAIILPIDEHLTENIASSIIHLQNHPEEMRALVEKGLQQSLSLNKEDYYKRFIGIINGEVESANKLADK